MTEHAEPAPAVPRSFGRFVLLERIGRGGMAEVYRARVAGVRDGRSVVVKRIRPELAADREMAALFAEESHLTARLRHRNVVEVLEHGRTDAGEAYIAMEYVRGVDLRQLHEHAARAERPIPAWLAIHVAAEILSGLDHLHRLPGEDGRPGRLVHCDVTPENILLGRSGEVKLADFGVAVDDRRKNAPLADRAKGKLPYMSPEQLLQEPLDARSDLFSCGVVLWECLTGRRLFPGRTPSEVMAQVCASPRPPPSRFARERLRRTDALDALDALVLGALAVDPGQRPAHAARFAESLQDVLRSMGVERGVEESFRAELTGLLDAPVVRPHAVALAEPGEGEGEDELEDLDRRHGEREPPSRSALDAAVEAYQRSTQPTERPTLAPPGRRRSDPWDPVTESARPAVPDPFREASEEPTGKVLATERDPAARSRTPRPRPASTPSFLPGPVPPRRARPASASPPRGLPVPPLAEPEPVPRSTSELEALIHIEPPREAEPRPPSSGGFRGPGVTPPPVLTGAHPLFVRHRGQAVEGPMTPAHLLGLLEHRCQSPAGAPESVSVDGHRWLPVTEIARILGEPLLARQLPASVESSGALAERSPIEVLGRAALARRTGRLYVARDRGDVSVLVELHLRAGELTHIRWSGAPFELWRSLFDDGRLGVLGLPEAFSIAVSTGGALFPRLPPEAGRRIGAARQRLALRWLERIAGWTDGRFAFDPVTPPHLGRRTQSVLRILPGVVYCALSPEDVQRRIGERGARVHAWCRFDEVAARLGLTQEESESLRALGGGPPLGVAAARLERTMDPRFVWSMVLVFTELGVLRLSAPRPSG